MRTLLLTGLTSLAIATGAQAQRVGLNFTDGWPTPMLQGETADGCSNWTDSRGANDWTDPSKGTITLLGTSLSAKWNSANTWAAGNENTSEQQIYRVYLDDGDGGNSLVNGDGIGASVTISGLSAWLTASGAPSYQIRCYGSTDTDNALFQPALLRLGAPNAADGANQLLNLPVIESVAIPVLGPGDFPPNTTPDPTWGMWQPRGYGTSSPTLTDDVITLTIAARNGSTRGTLAGFQLMAVPEPSSVALVGLGLAVLVASRRRN
jgi:hypothetical protein